MYDDVSNSIYNMCDVHAWCIYKIHYFHRKMQSMIRCLVCEKDLYKPWPQQDADRVTYSRSQVSPTRNNKGQNDSNCNKFRYISLTLTPLPSFVHFIFVGYRTCSQGSQPSRRHRGWTGDSGANGDTLHWEHKRIKHNTIELAGRGLVYLFFGK